MALKGGAMARASRAEWVKRVERWRDSGLTAKEFAAETGLKASTLTYWKWKLSADARAEGAGAQPPMRANRKRRSTCQSKTLVPKAAFVELAAAVMPAPSMLEVVLSDGLSVRVPTGFDEDTLVRVVRAVGAAR